MQAELEKGTPQPLLELPEVPEAVEHILEYVFEVGPVVGEHAVDWVQLAAWKEATGVYLGEFAATSVVTLCQVYLSQLREACDPKCPPPTMRRDALPSKTEISNGMRDMLRAMSASFKSKKMQEKRSPRVRKPPPP